MPGKGKKGAKAKKGASLGVPVNDEADRPNTALFAALTADPRHTLGGQGGKEGDRELNDMYNEVMNIERPASGQSLKGYNNAELPSSRPESAGSFPGAPAFQPPVRPTPSRGQPAQRLAGAKKKKQQQQSGGITRDRGAKKSRHSSSSSNSNIVRPSIEISNEGSFVQQQDDVALHFPGVGIIQEPSLGKKTDANNMSSTSSLFGGETRPEDRRYRRASMQGIDFKGSFRRKGLLARELGQKMQMGDWNFTTTEIRKLFRSFDTNNDHTLQHAEFQHGMTLMGLEAARDPYAFSRIVEEVDEDQTGEIDEEEFTRFFRKHKYLEIQQRLEHAQSKSTCTITVVEYGFTSEPMTETIVKDFEFGNWLKEHKDIPAGRKRWFDIRGYSHDVMRLIGMEYDLSYDMIKDAGTLQPTKVRVTSTDAKQRGDPSQEVAQFLFHTLSMVGTPFRNPSEVVPFWMRFKECCKRANRYDAEYFEHLKSARDLFRKPPHVTQRQVSLICIGDDLLFTIAPDIIDPDDEPERQEPIRMMYEVLDHVRELVNLKRPDVMTYGMKYMLTLIVQEVVENNFQVRDIFASWLDAIEESIEDEHVHKTSARDAAHLRAFAEMLTQYKQQMDGMTRCMAWCEMDQNSANVGTGKDMLDYRSGKSIAKFFKHQLVFYKDTFLELTAMQGTTNAMQDSRLKLKELQQSMSEARTNETLHFLTMITTLFLPVQVFSAIYGMNFQYIPEFGKKDATLAEGGDFMAQNGYFFFWLIVAASTIALASTMKITGYL